MFNDSVDSSYPSDFITLDHQDQLAGGNSEIQYRDRNERSGSTEERIQRESFIKERVKSLLRKMEIKEHHQLQAFDMLEFEEHEKGWDLLLRMIKSRTKESRAWQLVNRIKEVRRLYFNLIKKSNNLNQQIIVQTRAENRRRGRSSMMMLEQNQNMPVKEDAEGSSESSEEEEGTIKKGQISGKDGPPAIQLKKKSKQPVKKSKLEILREEMDKLTKDFVESSALFEELTNIYKKGERALKKKMTDNAQ